MQKPNELVFFVLGCVLNTVVVDGRLNILCVLQLSMQLSMNMLKTLCEFICGGDSRAFSDLRLEGGMVGEVGVKGSLFGGRVFGIVEYKLSDRQVVDPVVLLVRAVCTKVCLEHLIYTLYQAVSLRVIGC